MAHKDDIIDLTPFPILYSRETIILHKIFKKYSYDLKVAGGAVRDILLGIPPKDIDFATEAMPNQMLDMFSNEGIRTLNRNGEAHGTVTVRINDKVHFIFSNFSLLFMYDIILSFNFLKTLTTHLSSNFSQI